MTRSASASPIPVSTCFACTMSGSPFSSGIFVCVLMGAVPSDCACDVFRRRGGQECDPAWPQHAFRVGVQRFVHFAECYPLSAHAASDTSGSSRPDRQRAAPVHSLGQSVDVPDGNMEVVSWRLLLGPSAS